MRLINYTQIKIDGEILSKVQDDTNTCYYEYKVPLENKTIIRNLHEEKDNQVLNDSGYFRKQTKSADINNTHLCYYFEVKPKSRTLNQLVEQMMKKKYKSEELVIKILYQIIQALQILHSQGLMGRVFSSQNILINEDNYEITMMNFGFGSKILFQENRQQLDPTKSLLPFNANNQHQGKIYNEKLDIWLLGCILFHLLTHKEFTSNDIQTNIENNQESMIFKYEESQHYSQDLIDLLKKMLIIKQQSRIDFEDLVNNKLFNNFPRIDQLREYYHNFYKDSGDRKKIKEQIKKDYAAIFEITFDQREFQIDLQFVEQEEQNEQSTKRIQKFLSNCGPNGDYQLQLLKLMANLKFQKFIISSRDDKFKNTALFALEKLFIFQIRQIILIIIKDQQLYPQWQTVYEYYYNPFQQKYYVIDPKTFYENNLNIQFDVNDGQQQYCLKLLSKLKEKLQQQDGIHFDKYYGLLNADQIEQIQQSGILK